MGREIRRVPADWQHPRDEQGQYIPMYDETYEDAAAKWMHNYALFIEGKHESQHGKYATESKYYWEWDYTPNEELCRPAFTSEPTAYQIYETVSEGSPTSPVFQDKNELLRWLLGQGYTDKAASAFIEGGWAPSMIMNTSTGKLKMGVASLDMES